jgi:ribosomal small subunit protein bTHX
MGKGDKKSTKGKRWRGSYGNSRPSKQNRPEAVVAPKAEKKAKPAAKKPAAKKTAKKSEE